MSKTDLRTPFFFSIGYFFGTFQFASVETAAIRAVLGFLGILLVEFVAARKDWWWHSSVYRRWRDA